MLKHPARRIPEVPMTPLVDILFNILAFILVVGSLEQIVPQQLQVDIPKAPPIIGTPRGSDDIIHLVLDRQGRIRIGNRVVSKRELTVILRSILAGEKETMVWADRRVPYEDVIQLLVMVRENGGARAKLAVLPEETP